MYILISWQFYKPTTAELLACRSKEAAWKIYIYHDLLGHKSKNKLTKPWIKKKNDKQTNKSTQNITYKTKETKIQAKSR